jgi:hypothetical protein
LQRSEQAGQVLAIARIVGRVPVEIVSFLFSFCGKKLSRRNKHQAAFVAAIIVPADAPGKFAYAL